MIKSVSIQNFEAHEDTTIEFGEGMNSIVGKSNSGKSSILRCIMMVVDNEWDKDMVRNGCEFCRVKVVTERGWVEAERGEKVNRWRCCENGGEVQLFQKVGTAVPEMATRILGMGRRERGNGISELPNFQSQLEKHYMLAEVGDKKATSNMIAVMMDNAIGLGGMEDLIKDFSSDLLKDRKWLSEKQEEIVDLKTSIIDEGIFRSYEKDIAAINDLKDNVGVINEGIAIADGYMTAFSTAMEKSIAADTRVSKMPDCDRMTGLVYNISELDVVMALVEKIIMLNSAIDKSNRIMSVDSEKMTEITDRIAVLEKTIGMCSKALDGERRIERLSVMSTVDVDDGAVDDVSAMTTRIADAEKMLLDARDLWKRQANAVKEMKISSDELAVAEREFEKLKDELGVCPLCGNKL